MKKTILLLALLTSEAQATAPFRYRPDPLSKVITLPLPKDTFYRRIDSISKETGVKIAFDVQALAKQGITRNQLIDRLPPNQTAADLIVAICRSAENEPGIIVIRREDDGSLTITTK